MNTDLATKKLNLVEQAQLLNYKTPYFYTDLSIIKENYEHFIDSFDDAEVYYALKANSDPKVLTYLDQLGCGFEAASAHEIQLLLSLGVEPKSILYGTSVKPAEHIKIAFKEGVNRFAADSKEELDKIAANAPGAKIFIRAIVDDHGSVFMMSERFGTPPQTVVDLILYARSLNLKTYGVSFYVGSQAANSNMWAKGVQTVKPIIEELYNKGVILEVLNIGGGFPVHYDNHLDAPELTEIFVNIKDELQGLPYMPKIIMEPGRAIVATSTILVSEVIARNDRNGKPWLCMDAGVYNALYEALIHQGSTRYPAKPLNPPTEPSNSLKYTIAGPTGDSLDIIARDVTLPDYITVGDKLVFEHAGAYTVCMISSFNGFPPTPLYVS